MIDKNKINRQAIDFAIQSLQEQADALEKQTKGKTKPVASIYEKQWRVTISHIGVLRHEIRPKFEARN